MKIKYLKDAPRGKKDEVHEVDDFAAKILIIRGYAKEHKSRSRSKSSNSETSQNNDSE